MTEELSLRSISILVTQVRAYYQEFDKLSKKSPNDAVNKFKLKLINEIIASSSVALKDELRPFKDFQQFDETNIPSNSDVVIVLSQYLSSLERVQNDLTPARGLRSLLDELNAEE